MQNIRRDLLIRDDVNVIEVDWYRGALPPYTQATANTRLVGAEIALLIRFLKVSCVFAIESLLNWLILTRQEGFVCMLKEKLKTSAEKVSKRSTKSTLECWIRTHTVFMKQEKTKRMTRCETISPWDHASFPKSNRAYDVLKINRTTANQHT